MSTTRQFRTSRATWFVASLILLVVAMLFVPGDKGGRLAGPWIDLLRGDWNGSVEACVYFVVAFLICAVPAITLGWVVQGLIVITISPLFGRRKTLGGVTSNQSSTNNSG